VTAADVTKKFLQEIAIARAVPQMMMGIDDRQVRVDDFLMALFEPVLPDRRLDRGRDAPAGSSYNCDSGCGGASTDYSGTSRE
jgi:hypothetical protein